MLSNVSLATNEAEPVCVEEKAVPARHGLVLLLRLMALRHVANIKKDQQ